MYACICWVGGVVLPGCVLLLLYECKLRGHPTKWKVERADKQSASEILVYCALVPVTLDLSIFKLVSTACDHYNESDEPS